MKSYEKESQGNKFHSYQQNYLHSVEKKNYLEDNYDQLLRSLEKVVTNETEGDGTVKVQSLKISHNLENLMEHHIYDSDEL